MSGHEVTHASPECPLWGLDVQGSTSFVPKDRMLSVGAVHTGQSIAKQLAELEQIKKHVLEKCTVCPHHILPCEPGVYYVSNSFVSTLAVKQRQEIPQDIKEQPAFYYSDL